MNDTKERVKFGDLSIPLKILVVLGWIWFGLYTFYTFFMFY